MAHELTIKTIIPQTTAIKNNSKPEDIVVLLSKFSEGINEPNREEGLRKAKKLVVKFFEAAAKRLDVQAKLTVDEWQSVAQKIKVSDQNNDENNSLSFIAEKLGDLDMNNETCTSCINAINKIITICSENIEISEADNLPKAYQINF